MYLPKRRIELLQFIQIKSEILSKSASPWASASDVLDLLPTICLHFCRIIIGADDDWIWCLHGIGEIQPDTWLATISIGSSD
jgi:hypothetical protein